MLSEERRNGVPDLLEDLRLGAGPRVIRIEGLQDRGFLRRDADRVDLELRLALVPVLVARPPYLVAPLDGRGGALQHPRHIVLLVPEEQRPCSLVKRAAGRLDLRVVAQYPRQTRAASGYASGDRRGRLPRRTVPPLAVPLGQASAAVPPEDHARVPEGDRPRRPLHPPPPGPVPGGCPGRPAQHPPAPLPA